MEGLITKILSNDYTVIAFNKEYVCKSRGKFRNQKITPLVGDKVIFDDKNNYIMEVLSRRNSLIRPPLANIDQVFIITSCKDPNFSTNLLDKLLNIIEFNNIKPIICFTKLDLLTKEESENINNYINYYINIGYEVYLNTEISLIKKVFKNKITVFTGQSGAGKSTLLNKINRNLNLQTDEISYALGRGKHTTRFVQLLNIEEGLVADTPGFSAISFDGMKKSDIRDNFIEFNKYKDECKYRDCMHIKEDNCNIKDNNLILQSRYENYLKFVEEKK